MRHQLRIPLLSKPADQRKALLRGLTTQLIREGRVTTTKAKAKALRNQAERMISLAKEGTLSARRRAIGYIYDKKLVHSLFEKAQERYGDRAGGYTRIVRTVARKGIMHKWLSLSLFKDKNKNLNIKYILKRVALLFNMMDLIFQVGKDRKRYKCSRDN